MGIAILMPSTGQLMRARRRFASALPDRATIHRSGAVADGGGGQLTTYSPIATDVPCRLSPVGGGELAQIATRGGDRISDQATAIVTFAAATDVKETDQLVIGGTTFDVTLVRLRGEWELSRRCEVREL